MNSTMRPTTSSVRQDWLEKMLLIRRFEEAAERLSVRGKIPAGVHPAIGQEGVAVGAMTALDPGDVVCGTHRSHHLALARGLDPAALMAELFGKGTGLLGGRGGSMHLADFDLGFWGSNGIVGAGIGMAMGAALGIHMRGHSQVAVGFVGDGGMNVGRLWEDVNLAVVWGLPLLIIVENNLYAVETTSKTFTGGGSIIDRAAGFGIEVARVDGQDVDAVHDHVSVFRERAIAGGGPGMLEAETYRFSGHGSGEKANYRSGDEIESWRATRDPIVVLRDRMFAAGQLEPEHMQRAERHAETVVEEAVLFAEAAEWPEPATAVTGVDGWRTPGGATWS